MESEILYLALIGESNMVDLKRNYTMSSKLYCKCIQDSQVYIYNKLSKTACFLSEKEFEILKKLDGKSNYYDLLNKDVFVLSEQGYEYYINKMISLNLLAGFEKKPKFSLIRYKIGLFNPNSFLENKNGLIFLVFIAFFILSIPLVILGFNLIDHHMYFEAIKSMISIKTGILLYFVSFVFLGLHELSHAIVAKKGGAEVVEFGLMFYLFMPFVYVTIGGSRNIDPRYKNLISAAGMLTNLFFLGAFMCIVGVFKCYNSLLCSTAFFCNFSQILLNIDPFLKVDSSFILGNILGIDNIYDTARKPLKEINASYAGASTEKSALLIYKMISVSTTFIIAAAAIIYIILFIKNGGDWIG